MTFPCCGFSFAVSGMIIPPFVFSLSSILSTNTLSFNGLIFMNDYLLFLFLNMDMGKRLSTLPHGTATIAQHGDGWINCLKLLE